MKRPLGKNQLELLRQLANPWLQLIVGDRVAHSLERRGLLRACGEGSFFQITPNGMRAVAAAWEAGEVEFPDKPVTKDS